MTATCRYLGQHNLAGGDFDFDFDLAHLVETFFIKKIKIENLTAN